MEPINLPVMKRILSVAILLGLVAVSCDTDKMKKGQMANSITFEEE